MSKSKGSPTITVRLWHDLLDECHKAIENGKAQNMTELVKKALISYLQLDPEHYLIEL